VSGEVVVTAATPPPVTGRTVAGYLAMVVGLFMAVLDIQIVASSLAEIQAGLSASLDEISWVQTSYLIAEVIVIPLSGWLARLLSTRILFAGAALGFTLASLACAMAWDIASMAAFRAVQGLLGGVMIPTVFSAVYIMFPPERRGSFIVLAGLVATIAPTVGPTLGGWITTHLSWHWLFLINLAPGLLVALAVLRLVDIDRPDPGLLRRIDGPGILLVALFLGTLEYILEEGPGEDWLDSATIRTLVPICAAAGIALVWRELTTAHPVVNLRAFRDRNFTLGCLFSFVVGVGLYGSVYVMPLFLATVRGHDALAIGTIMAVTGAFQFLSGPLAGAAERRLDLRLMLAIGLVLFGAGLWLNVGLTHQSDFRELFWPQAVRGIAIMFCFLPMTQIALGRLPREEVGNASGLYNLMRNLGGAIGLAAIDTLLDRRIDLHVDRLHERLDPARLPVAEKLEAFAAYLSTFTADPDRPQRMALALADGLARREALVMAFDDVFFVLSAVFFAALLLLPLVRAVPHAREEVPVEAPEPSVEEPAALPVPEPAREKEEAAAPVRVAAE